MKYTKTLVAATLLATCALSQPVLAKDAVPATPSPTAATFANGDLSFAFGQTAQPVQVAALSEQEMKETEGAFGRFNPNIFNWSPQGMAVSGAYGAASGGISYTANAFGAGTPWRFNEFAGSVAGGAVGAVFGNPALAAMVGAGVGGYAGGLASRINWSFRF